MTIVFSGSLPPNVLSRVCRITQCLGHATKETMKGQNDNWDSAIFAFAPGNWDLRQ